MPGVIHDRGTGHCEIRQRRIARTADQAAGACPRIVGGVRDGDIGCRHIGYRRVIDRARERSLRTSAAADRHCVQRQILDRCIGHAAKQAVIQIAAGHREIRDRVVLAIKDGYGHARTRCGTQTISDRLKGDAGHVQIVREVKTLVREVLDIVQLQRRADEAVGIAQADPGRSDGFDYGHRTRAQRTIVRS